MFEIKISTSPKPVVSRNEMIDFYKKAALIMQSDMEANAELNDFYIENEEAMLEDLRTIVDDFVDMKIQADELRGNWLTNLKYRLSSR